ncbi:MAG: bifunctional folylpolyglutamate synthase/dihydrofolate synthase, partial [Candidatus Margulisiibacteriota bacterium]
MRYASYLASLEKFGINLGLERITYLLKKLGDPHLKFKSIHIAGTNGKGSTAAMTASILKEAGYKVGLYTSPHLFDYRERININGKDISKSDFGSGLELIKKTSNKLANKPTNKPTVFEALTAVAFWYFAKKKVDY